jgi:DNA-directed RNA polymerase specialized sigma24 family protein
MLFLGPAMEIETEQLLERVIEGNARALRELLVRIRPHSLQVIWDRFARLGHEAEDILDEAESLLFEWSLGRDARERLLRGESLGKLAFRLVWEVVRRRRRDKQRQVDLAGEVVTHVASHSVDPPASGFGIEAIVAVILTLPETHREVLLAEARCQLGEGPPLAEALGVLPGTARSRLKRARAFLLPALAERGLSELMDLETDDG